LQIAWLVSQRDNQTPDKPQSFGYKVSWLGLKTSDPAAVLDALELGEATPTNWESGLAAVYDSERSDACVFVSPPVGGWVFAVSGWLPYPTVETHHDIGEKFDALFSRLMKRFDDVQFFGSHRVVDFVAWAHAFNGKPMRVFAWVGSAGAVLANIGEQTLEEAKLGLANLTGLSPAEAGDEIFKMAEQQDAEVDALVATGFSRRDALTRVRQSSGHAFPDENDVVELAALWSIDPMELSEQDHPPSLGLAARLPEHLIQ
jgi:hypothetical protein